MPVLLFTDEVAKAHTGYSKIAIQRKFDRGQIPNNDTVLLKRWGKWHIDLEEWYKLVSRGFA